jgi:uncharacterized cofD-like protein
MPPPCDLRNCLVALSAAEAVLSQLFQHRFDAGEGLKGHSFGNLFLTAMTQVTGDFAQAVRVCSDVLAIAGRIYPSTSSDVRLRAQLADGTEVLGESNISRSRQRIVRIDLEPAHCSPLPETLRAIDEADIITIGPGSLFTSLVPNLLVDGISDAIRRSRARVVYIGNLMWQPGETTGFTAADHVQAIHDHASGPILDTVILNTAGVTEAQLARYERESARPVENDYLRLEEMNLTILTQDLIGRKKKIRHDPDVMAHLLLQLAAEARQAKARSPGGRFGSHSG